MPYFQSKQVKLSNVISLPIQTGFQVREKAYFHPQGKYNLIQVKDAQRSVFYRINSSNLDKFLVPEKKEKFMSKYLIQKNDVLYLSKLNPGAFRYIGPIEHTVPMAHFYILRPKIKYIDADYLSWVLNQSFMKPYIQKCLKGTMLPFISRDALYDCLIPLPSIDIQRKIIELLKLKEQERKINDKIDQKQNIIINQVLRRIL